MKTRYFFTPFHRKGLILFGWLLALLLLSQPQADAQIAEWTFENIGSAVPSLPISPSQKVPQVRASATLSGGNNNGSPDACSGSETWSTNFWPTSAGRDPGAYLEFSVKADPGEYFAIDYFSFSSNASSDNSALSFDVYYSKNNFITSQFMFSGTQSTGGCSSHGGSVGANLLPGSTIKIRIYPYGQNVAAQAATIRLDNVSISGALLPVDLQTFEARREADQIELYWVTAMEVNNDYFQLERSGDGVTFQPIGKIKGAGTTQSEQYYDFTDQAPLANDNYYRLRQVDFDGTEEVHSIVHVLFTTSELARFAIWPSICSEQIQVRFSNDQSQQPLFLWNMKGELLKTIAPGQPGEVRRIAVNELPAGWYFVQSQSECRRFFRSH